MRLAELTPRRRELVGLLLKGCTSEQVCDCMGVSESAFRKLKSLTYQQLGIRTDMQLLAVAVSDALTASDSTLEDVLELLEDLLS